MRPADFGSAIIFPQLRPWHLSLGWFGAGGRHVSRFGSMQERPGPRDGGEHRGKAQRHPKVTHLKTPSGPCGPGMELFGREVPTAAQVGKGTCTSHCHPGHISIQSPRHLPATSPTRGGSSSPSKHSMDPIASSLPPPSTRHLHHQCPSPTASGRLPGHLGSPWQDMGRGDRAWLPQSLNSRGCREQISDVLWDKSCGARGPGHQQAGKLPLPLAKSLPRRRTVGYGTRPEVGFKEITTSPPG